MLIKDFYANREIFITGATGFLGKSLIEKLLRDCQKLKTIYILMRGKKSLGVHQRLEKLKQNKVFDRIHKECPKALDKLYAIDGDSMELGLGIKLKDLEMLSNVSIIFHMAANVKFDDPLRNSILLNTRGTYELVKIAEKLKNLIVFMHCSTVYCNPLKDTIEEKVYEAPADWRTTIKMAEKYDEETLNTLCLKYTGYFPNTYTFTKNLSEQIILEYSFKLPMFLFRPSIVINSHKEPVAGWIDNMNGPLSAMVALGIGITPTVFCRRDLFIDCVPVDMVTKMTLVAAYKKGLKTLKKEPLTNGLEVVNCASGGIFNINMHIGTILYYRAIRKNPMENCFWSFDPPWITSSYVIFLLYILFMNIPMSLIMDNILRIMGQKPLLYKMQRRIIYTTKITKFFSIKEYKIMNKNMINLENSIPISEHDTFGITVHINDNDYDIFFENIVCGVKENLFNHPIKATEAARKRYNILIMINKSIKFILFSLFINYLWSIISSL